MQALMLSNTQEEIEQLKDEWTPVAQKFSVNAWAGNTFVPLKLTRWNFLFCITYISSASVFKLEFNGYWEIETCIFQTKNNKEKTKTNKNRSAGLTRSEIIDIIIKKG